MSVNGYVLRTTVDQFLLKHPDRLTPGTQVMQQIGKCRISHLEGIFPVHKG